MKSGKNDRFWEFFENIDEIVYVADADTYETVYMNAYLRKLLNIDNDTDYTQKKCFAAIHDKTAPCEFCTNERLKEGEFISWIHKNDALNKKVSVKDSIIYYDNHRYRVTIAIDLEANGMDSNMLFCNKTEYVLNECMQRIFSDKNPDVSMYRLLDFIGATFNSDRAYIFEFKDNGCMRKTYELFKGHTLPQIDLPGNEIDSQCVDWWIEAFENSEIICIDDVEDISEAHPATYQILKSQGIASLIVAPISDNDRLIGFVGLDNPDMQMKPLIMSLLRVIGYFIDSLLKRRDSLNSIQQQSFRDSLTGIYNRNAFFEDFYADSAIISTAGIIYCDITGLKHINDAFGHEEGDRLLNKCSSMLCDVAGDENVYRIGGDEFVVFVRNDDKETFYAKVQEIEERTQQSQYHIAIGSTWTDDLSFKVNELLAEAEKLMYIQKNEFYSHVYNRETLDNKWIPELKYSHGAEDYRFDQFVATTYCDVESLCQSMTKSNASFYLFFGDVQKDIFYVSDNLRDKFGFRSNIVPGLLRRWENCIPHQDHLDLYRQDMDDMFREKREIHDLRYQVRDVEGNDIWIRCYGILKWNNDKTVPLFFSGRLSCQDNEFVVDPLTNLLRNDAAVRRLQQLREAREVRDIIGLRLNGLAEINNTRGRAYGNRLIQLIANHLAEEMNNKLFFYRLDGMNFMAIVNPKIDDKIETLIEDIRKIATNCYIEMNLPSNNCCFFGLIRKRWSNISPEELPETMNMLLKAIKNEQENAFVEYSPYAIEDVKVRYDMVILLNANVINGMENFRVAIQPVVSTEDGRIIGGEALMRWSFNGEDISPSVFIPLLEKENIINTAGRWVFERAVSICSEALEQNPDFYVSFNVSFNQLSDKGFIDYMASVMKKYGVDGSHLVAELTETHFDEKPEMLLKFVDGCYRLGMRVALDDFGNGYSSLRMLLQYPSNIVKLDRSLLIELAESKEKLKFIRSIVFACHQFDKTVCIEGVENMIENDMVIDAGCDCIQGFYYYRPMEIELFYGLLDDTEEKIV